MKKVIALVICLVMSVTVICGCQGCQSCQGCQGCSGKQSESSTTVEPTASETTQASETTTESDHKTFTGILIDGSGSTITVLGEDDEMEFDVSNTEFVNAENGLTLGDTLTVTYSEVRGEYWATMVVIDDEAAKVEYTFSGIVSDLHDELVDVTNETSTVRFEMNADTKVEGNLTIGDTVTVTSDTTISTYPMARKIVVTSENEKPEKHVCMGWISTMAGGQIYVSIESSHGFYFKVDANTRITGKATELKVGQKVGVTYEGDIDSTPTASVVEVIEDAKTEIYKISGTVAKVAEGSITIKVDANECTFKTTSDTKYTGEKPQAGYRATIQYTGTIESGATAVAIECAAPEPETTTAAPTTQETTAAPTTAAPTTGETTAAPTTEPETTTTHPVIPSIDGSVKIVKWASSDNTCTVLTAHNKTIKLTIADDIDIPIGYMPAEGDIVKIKYNMMTMQLLEMKLIGRPETMCQGTIVSWSDGKCVIKDIEIPKDDIDNCDDSTDTTDSTESTEKSDSKLKDMDNVEFVIADNIDMLIGYSPKAGDVVKFEYKVTEANSGTTSSSGDDTIYMLTMIRFVSKTEK